MLQFPSARAEDQTILPEEESVAEATALPGEESVDAENTDLLWDGSITEEDESRRGECERHFLCEDGSYVAVSYGYPVNYQDEDGEWKEIDNTLVTVTEEDGTQTVRNTDGPFDVCFSADGEGEELLSLTQGDYAISFGLKAVTDADAVLDSIEAGDLAEETASHVFGKEERKAAKQAEKAEKKAAKEAEKAAKKAAKEAEKDAKKAEREQKKAELGLENAEHGKVSAPGQIKKGKYSATETERLFSAERTTAELIYENAFGAENVDVDYTVLSTGVKENILLQSVTDITSYEAVITADGLTAVLQEDGSICFTDEAGTDVFTVSAPVMLDAAGEESNDIAVTLAENGDGSITVTYTPSLAWLLDESRVYPVNIDPSVSTSRDTSYIIDTYVIENGAAGSANYTSPFFYAGKQSDGRDIDTYLRFDKKSFSYSSGIANIPKYSYIDAAAINFFLAPTVNSTKTETAGNALKITPLDESWSQTTIRYESGKQLSGGATQTISLRTNSAGRKYYSFNVTDEVAEAFYTYWETGSLTDDYGWRIESDNEMERLWSGNAGYNGSYGASTDRPYIWVRYYSYDDFTPANLSGGTYSCTINNFKETISLHRLINGYYLINVGGKYLMREETTKTKLVSGEEIYDCTPLDDEWAGLKSDVRKDFRSRMFIKIDALWAIYNTPDNKYIIVPTEEKEILVQKSKNTVTRYEVTPPAELVINKDTYCLTQNSTTSAGLVKLGKVLPRQIEMTLYQQKSNVWLFGSQEIDEKTEKDNHQLNGWLDTVEDYFQGAKYSLTEQTYITYKSTMLGSYYNTLANSKVAIINAHGSNDGQRLAAENENGKIEGRKSVGQQMAVSNVSSVNRSGIYFSNFFTDRNNFGNIFDGCELVVFVGCETGQNTEMGKLGTVMGEVMVKWQRENNKSDDDTCAKAEWIYRNYISKAKCDDEISIMTQMAEEYTAGSITFEDMLSSDEGFQYKYNTVSQTGYGLAHVHEHCDNCTENISYSPLMQTCFDAGADVVIGFKTTLMGGGEEKEEEERQPEQWIEKLVEYLADGTHTVEEACTLATKDIRNDKVKYSPEGASMAEYYGDLATGFDKTTGGMSSVAVLTTEYYQKHKYKFP